MAYEKNFSFIRIEFKFVGGHPVLNGDKALLQAVERGFRVSWEGNMQLSIISTEVVMYWLASKDTTQWPGVESEKKWSKNRPLWNTKWKGYIFQKAVV